ncbi:MAG: glycosyltransferase, partial [Nitrososphaera sp.]
SVKSRMNDLESIMFDLPGSDYEHILNERAGNASGRLLVSSKARAADWYEIIVVNDGSEDGTRDVLEGITEKDCNVRMISYSTNMGKGYAIKQGILKSHGKYVIFMDGDGEISADLLMSYLEELRRADIVIASKYHPASIVNVPHTRKFLSKCFNVLVKTAVRVRVSDTQAGLKAGRGDAFKAIFRSVVVKRYAFDVEMLALATLLGLRIKEMPVKIDIVRNFRIKEIMRMALDVAGIAYRLRVIKWYQKRVGQ